MAIFRPKRWVNPSGKMSNFRLFKLLFFLALYCIKKKVEKWPFFDQNHGLTPLEKCQFYFFLNFLFLQPRKVFFRCRISSKTFSCSILREKTTWKNRHFWTKTMGSPLWKNVHFSTFFNFLFLQPRKEFFVLEYRKRHFPYLYCLKKTSWKNGHFWTKSMGGPLWKNVNFLTCSTFFLQPREAFFVLEYLKRYFPSPYCLKK